MEHFHGSYWKATRHPWPCFLFLLPLLAAYEGGVVWLGGTQPEVLRNGADTWMHWGLEAFGLSQLYWTPILVAAGFLFWSWIRLADRPRDVVGVCAGMAMESMFFAVGLWGLNRGLAPCLEMCGIKLDCPPQAYPAAVHAITFVGAGIYEEVLFRLLLFAGLVRLLQQAEVPASGALLLSAVASALVFSAAHNAGPYGEMFDSYIFLFRTLAGLYFTLLFRLRGFGIAVGAHACYDVLAGILVN